MTKVTTRILSKFLCIKYPDVDLREYFDFIGRVSLTEKVKGETVCHHILPKWAFPEFKSLSTNPWNCSILSHKNHIVAHFMLWDVWRNSNNASPLLLMCSKSVRDGWSLSTVSDYSEEYHLACVEHGKRVSITHTGKIVTDTSKARSKQTRLINGTDTSGMYPCLDVLSGKSVYITVDEYKEGKDKKFVSYNANKPAWNSGTKSENTSGKLTVYHKGTRTPIFIESSEYYSNINLYDHPCNGHEGVKTNTPAYNLETGVLEFISIDEYKKNKSKYKHPCTGLVWYNDGIKNMRINNTDKVPLGFVVGRLKSDLVGHKKKTVQCPHCNKVGASGNMMRYHFDKCKKIVELSV